MHFLEAAPELKNDYAAQRHGQSEANVKGILLSNLADGTTGYGLTEKGRRQVALAAYEAKAAGFGQDKPLVFVVSPFLRALQTAQISQSILGGFIVVDERLRERYFGDYDRQSDKNLQHIWDLDSVSEHNKDGKVESPAEVQQRIAEAIQDIEASFEGYQVVLVGHGDTLQIAETAFKQLPASKHRRSIRHFDNGAIRKLRLWRRLHLQ